MAFDPPKNGPILFLMTDSSLSRFVWVGAGAIGALVATQLEPPVTVVLAYVALGALAFGRRTVDDLRQIHPKRFDYGVTFASGAIAVVVLGFGYHAYLEALESNDRLADAGALGDTLGGYFGTAVSFASAILFAAALFLQRRQLDAQREEIVQQRQSIVKNTAAVDRAWRGGNTNEFFADWDDARGALPAARDFAKEFRQDEVQRDYLRSLMGESSAASLATIIEHRAGDVPDNPLTKGLRELCTVVDLLCEAADGLEQELLDEGQVVLALRRERSDLRMIIECILDGDVAESSPRAGRLRALERQL